MRLLDLPPELLVLVLTRSLRSHGKSNRAQRANLRLLSICSKLRQLALPLVYQRVSFHYSPQGASRFEASDAIDGECGAYVSTNMYLVLAADGLRNAREVYISTSYIVKPTVAYWAIIELMRAVAPVWSWVNTLTVTSSPAYPHTDMRDIDMDRGRFGMVAVGNAFASLMPGLRQLDCRGHYTPPVLREMCESLVGHLAGTLVKVVSEYPICVPADCRLGAARDLRLWSSGGPGWQPPRISADALERLDMMEWMDDDIASFIDTNSNSNHIAVLPALKSMKLDPVSSFGEDKGTADVEQYRQRLHLPALGTLRIRCNDDECFLWSSAVLPARMESLHLQITDAACEAIAQTTLPKVRRLILKVRAGSRGELFRTTINFDAVNHILSSAGGDEVKGLVLMDVTTQVHPGSITCADLTMLELPGDTHADKLLELLRRQPRLRSLKISHLFARGLPADMSIPGMDENRLAAPLHANLEDLVVGRLGGFGNNQQDVLAVKRLLLGLPKLTKFTAYDIPKVPFGDFVRDYAPQYPHLADINLDIIIEDGRRHFWERRIWFPNC